MSDAETVAELRLAVASLIDVVKELMIAAESGHVPEEDWVDTVCEVLDDHKITLGFTG